MSAHEIGRLTSPAMTLVRGPRISDLKGRDLKLDLGRNHIGRVAFMGEGGIELLPVHYVYAAGAIVGRTSIGGKYLSWLTRDQVVFEVDESDGLFDWRSVIVRGQVNMLASRGSEADRANYKRAVEALRTLVSHAFTRRDPMRYRSIVFAIVPSSMTGRMASSRPLQLRLLKK